MVEMLHQQASDSALMLTTARGNESALAELYRRHAGAVNGLALRVTRDTALAEEVVQEVFMRLWRRPERFDPDRGTFRAFLLADTHGRSVDVVRSEHSRRRREERDQRSEPTRTAPAAEREALQSTINDEIRSALGQLPDGERKAIELAYFQGYTYRETAEALGEPEGTVKSRIRSGLVRLRESVPQTFETS